jgi:hypothetical protein
MPPHIPYYRLQIEIKQENMDIKEWNKEKQKYEMLFQEIINFLKDIKWDSLKPKEFNGVNPAYIQIKNGFNYTDNVNNAIVAITGVGVPSKSKKISVNNIVADKINLLTYNGSPNFNLTERDLINSTTPYITDDEMNTILSTAHPLVFGDILLEYLKALRAAFDSHIHNNFGMTPPTDNVTLGNAVSQFKILAPKLESTMLSKNIKIN